MALLFTSVGFERGIKKKLSFNIHFRGLLKKRQLYQPGTIKKESTWVAPLGALVVGQPPVLVVAVSGGEFEVVLRNRPRLGYFCETGGYFGETQKTDAGPSISN